MTIEATDAITKEFIILAIESSCDDTGVALYSSKQGLIHHLKASQTQTHLPYGGVVPELAARDHLSHASPLISQCLQNANLTAQQLDAVAYTKGPGLSGALLVGASIATGMAMALNIPAIGVHHMEGHLLAPMLENDKPNYPFTALLVSGGHTMLVDVRAYGDYKILGQSVDDALGEAFDKTAKMMGLSYPGGPLIEQLAAKWMQNPLYTTSPELAFTKPMIKQPGMDFSFSGLKTQVKTYFDQSNQDENTQQQIAYAFQKTVLETIVIKCQRALKVTGHQQLVISGGVSANQLLRQYMKEKIAAKPNHQGQAVKVFYPRLEFCTDNGAMIAYAGMQQLIRQKQDSLSQPHDNQAYQFNVKSKWSIEEI